MLFGGLDLWFIHSFSCDLLWVGFAVWLGGSFAEAWGVMLVGALGSCFEILPIAMWWIPGYCNQLLTWWGMSLHQLGLRFHWSGPLCCISIMVVSLSLLNPSCIELQHDWVRFEFRFLFQWLAKAQSASPHSVSCHGLRGQGSHRGVELDTTWVNVKVSWMVSTPRAVFDAGIWSSRIYGVWCRHGSQR